MNSPHLIRAGIVCAVSLAVACGGTDLLAPTPESLQGRWATVNNIPGSGESWDLMVQGSAISGTGSWSGEACCAGTLSLTGTIAGDSIHVDLTFVVTSSANPRAPFHSHFDGALTSRTVLRGTVTNDDGTSGEERLQRQ
jgi:hypothetical protein